MIHFNSFDMTLLLNSRFKMRYSLKLFSFLPTQPLHKTQLARLSFHLKPTKPLQLNYLAFSCLRRSLAVFSSAGVSLKTHDPHLTGCRPQIICTFLYEFASCNIDGQIALFPGTQKSPFRTCSAFRLARKVISH